MQIIRCIYFTAWITVCAILNNGVNSEIVNENLNTYDLQDIIEQVFNPSPEYELHSLALRNQLKRMLESEQFGKGRYFSGYPVAEEGVRKNPYGLNLINKRFLGSVLRQNNYVPRPMYYYDMSKKSLATLAKNGQLPTTKPEDIDGMEDSDEPNEWTEKRNVGALARAGGFGAGKRNIGTLARDYQLPGSNGKRDMSMPFMPYYKRMYGYGPTKVFLPPMVASGKRNLGALKASLVHGNTPKRFVTLNEEDGPFDGDTIVGYSDGGDTLNILDSSEAKEKRYLGRVLPPTRATSTTHRTRL